MEIYFKLNTDGTYFGEFHETKPEGYITKEELPTITVQEIVPEYVTALQFIIQLSLEGISESDIITVINTLSEPNKTIAKVSFYRATIFERNNPLLLIIGQAFEFDSAKLDEIFINANKI